MGKVIDFLKEKLKREKEEEQRRYDEALEKLLEEAELIDWDEDDKDDD